ncbi:hypothetical protein I4U23_016671 [Adineta vaga]|nr:hypothetical protein I4U23_016671 [Adineta vaga]
MNASRSIGQFNENATSVVVQLQYSYETGPLSLYDVTVSYCTINNCNFNLATCVARINNSPSSSSCSTQVSTIDYSIAISFSTLTTATSTTILNRFKRSVSHL